MKKAAHIPTNEIAAGNFTKIDMASVYCVSCHLPGAVDDQLCFHCLKVPRSQTPARQNETQILLLVIFWLGIAACSAVAWMNAGAK